MAGHSEKKNSKNRILQYRLFGVLSILLNLIYFHRVPLSFFFRDTSVQWIPTIVEFFGVIAIQVHYAICIMARARDIGGEKADSWGLDYFVLTAVVQLLKLYTKSARVYLLLFVLPVHTLYSLRGIAASMMPLLGVQAGPNENQVENVNGDRSSSGSNKTNNSINRNKGVKR